MTSPYRTRRALSFPLGLASLGALVLLILWDAGPGLRRGPQGEALGPIAAPRSKQAAAEPARVERRLALMGTGLTLRLEAEDRASGLATSETFVRALEAAERRLSTWTEDSELARLNAAPVGTAVRLSPRLAAELATAQRWSDATNGLFDPALGPLVRAWSLRTGGARPDAKTLAAARAASGSEHWSFADGNARRLHVGAALEEGAFGKGAALDAALEAIADRSWSALSVDLGGQLLEARHDRPVERFVADPDERGRAVLAWRVDGGSLATTGDSERGLVVDGEPRSHVLDPRTGAPAPRRGSATVLAPDALTADCLSTACSLLEPEHALALADTLDGVELVLLERVGERLVARASAGLRGRLTPLVPDLALSHSERGTADEPGDRPTVPVSTHAPPDPPTGDHPR